MKTFLFVFFVGIVAGFLLGYYPGYLHGRTKGAALMYKVFTESNIQ